MAAGREKIGINMMVQPKLDPKAAAQVIRDVAALHKRLAAIKMDWNEVAKNSGVSTQELQTLGKQVKNFAKGLSDATKTSTIGVMKLSSELKKAQKEAVDLKSEYATTKDRGAKKRISGEISSTNKTITTLTKQLELNKKQSHKYGDEVKHLTLLQKKYRSQIEQAAKYTPKDMVKDLLESITRGISSGGPKGVIAAAAGAGGAIRKGVVGGAARSHMKDPENLASALGVISKGAIGISLAVGALGMFWEAIKKASDHQTMLNKALLAGTGYANDFNISSEKYSSTIADMRNAVIDAQKPLRGLGLDSEKTMKMVNAYTIEATGSIGKTKKAITDLGGGDVTRGMEVFARNAVVYGKALGIESNDVASMMGKFETEAGYGAGQVQSLMGKIVKSATMANMPMTKFMQIFKSVLPDVELYQNRLEELTATIKLLSKTMSPRDVQRFMDAFSKGFKGVSFHERLGHVLVAGVQNVNAILKKDFAAKADIMSDKFDKLAPDIGAAFREAFASGDTKKINDALTRAKSAGATGTDIGEAMKLFQQEKERKKGAKGDALAMASALKGAGLWSTIKTMSAEMKRFGMGGRITGIAEQVASKRGYSQDQIEAMNQLISTMSMYQQSLKDYGTTGSKSIDKALKVIIAKDKKKDVKDLTRDDLASATQDEIAAANEASIDDKKIAKTATDYAAEQVTATMSISDKIDNIVGYYLEKLFQAMQGVLSRLDNIWDKWMGGDAHTINKVDKYNKGIQESGYSKDAKAQMSMVASSIKDAIGQNLSGADFTTAVIKSPAFENLSKLDSTKIEQLATKHGMSGSAPQMLRRRFEDASKNKNEKEMAAVLNQIPDAAGTLMEVGQDLLQFGTTKAAKDEAATSRPGAGGVSTADVLNQKAETQEDLDNNNDDNVKILSKMAGVAGTTTLGAAATPRTGTTTVDHIRKSTEDQTDEITKNQSTIAEDQEDETDHVYDGIQDVAGILKKGIKFERSWMTSQYRNFLKSATLESFEQALTEFAILQAKMEDDSDFRQAMLDNSQGLIDGNVDLTDLAKLQQKDGEDRAQQVADIVKNIPSRQTGGAIDEGGLYNLHKGEYVMPAGKTGVQKSGVGNTVVNLNVYGSNMTPQQLRGVVISAMDEVARRQ